MIKDTIGLLGRKAVDKVTGFSGVITSVSFDLYGCVQAVVHPGMKDGKIEDACWFDVQRLDISGQPVMTQPDFDARALTPASYDKGPADKPRLNKA